jgi:hypothetical protein
MRNGAMRREKGGAVTSTVTTANGGTRQTRYPQREPFFAHRYCRLLTKTCAAQDIGQTAALLCMTIAHIEDSKRYSGPVSFYNEQLMPLIGITKWESLDIARKRAVRFGWLQFEPGNRGRREPGRYWVTIPNSASELDDSPCDESHYLENGEWTPEPLSGKGVTSGVTSGVTIIPIPNPVPCSEPSAKSPEPAPGFQPFPVTGGSREWILPASKLTEWRAAFESLDVAAELRRARQWLVDNPSRRKTSKGMTRFCNSWLSREQDNGRGHRAGSNGEGNDKSIYRDL